MDKERVRNRENIKVQKRQGKTIHYNCFRGEE